MAMLVAGAGYFDATGKIVLGHGLLIDEGRIRRIAKMAEFGGFAGEVLDAAGCTVLPGLIDCHVHLTFAGEGNPKQPLMEMSIPQLTLRALQHAQTTVRGGITAVRDCGGKDYLELSVRDAIHRGTFWGPTIRAVGRMICMTGGHGNFLGRVADGMDDVVKAVREQVHAGCDQVKIMATGGVMTPGVNPEDAHFTAEEMAAGIREANRFSRKTASHAQGSAGILNAVRGGINSIEHGIFMTDECVREMIARQTYLVPTLSAVHNILRNAERVPAYAVEKSRRVVERHRESIRLFYKAGGRLAMGTDAGTPFNLHGDNARELEFMVEEGIGAADALLSATRNAADLLSLPSQGTLAEGNDADLLIVKGDPVRDITAASRRENHRAVFKGGKLVS